MNIYAMRMEWDDPGACACLERLLPFLSADEQGRIARLRRREDRLRAIAGRACVRWLLCTRFALDNSSLRFGAGSCGKPFLQEPRLGVHYNISHSGEWVAVVLAAGETGIDLQSQEHGGPEPFLGFLSREEAEVLAQLEGKERLDCFYRLWTLKESYVKALGKGMQADFRSFSILPAGSGWAVFPPQPYVFRQYPLAEGYALSVCAAEGSGFPEAIRLIRPEEIVLDPK